MNRLEQARDVIRRQRTLPEALHRIVARDEDLSYFDGRANGHVQGELTPDVLARSLHYLVELELRTIDDESAVPLGSSKYKGLPHLPAEFAWPDGLYFMAQFDCAQLHPFDMYGAFPDTGVLYIFFSTEGGGDVVWHYDGPLDALQVTPYPDPATLPGSKYYLEDFTEAAALIDFSPAGIFYLGGDAYDLSEVADAIPDDLKRQVSAAMGCPLVSWDVDLRIFGRAMYWQGEDDIVDEAADTDDEPSHLLLQDEFGEGHIHVWIDPADARERNYSACFVDYSGT